MKEDGQNFVYTACPLASGMGTAALGTYCYPSSLGLEPRPSSSHLLYRPQWQPLWIFSGFSQGQPWEVSPGGSRGIEKEDHPIAVSAGFQFPNHNSNWARWILGSG